MSLQYRVDENGFVPLIDIMRIAKRNLTVVKRSAKAMNMTVTPGVHFKQRWGKQHIDAINMKDAQPLIDYLAQLKVLGPQRNPTSRQFRPPKRWSARRRAAQAEKRAEKQQADNEETFADFEAAARKMLRLAEKFNIEELVFSDGTLEYTRTTTETATIEK